MTIQATAQILRSFTGAVVFGLCMDLVSRHLTSFLWFTLREVVSLVFWGALASAAQASQTQVLRLQLLSLGCPLHILASLRPLLHLVSAAV